jgi:hypothetical protein
MKTGVIVYAAGDPPPHWSGALENNPEEYDPDADMVKLITHTTGHFDLHDAWFELVCKGMSRVICKMAEFNEAGQMRLTGREMRLCG